MKTVSKYLLLQIPGWIILGAVLYFLWKEEWISTGVALGIFALGLLKDFVLYPFLKKAYEPGGKSGSDHLIGTRGIARDPLNPSGLIRINGELWRAQVEGENTPIHPGTEVRITAVRGFTLIVEKNSKDLD